MTGILTGVAIGALLAMAMSPQIRRPVMDGASRMGDRMSKMWRRGQNQAQEMMPGDMS